MTLHVNHQPLDKETQRGVLKYFSLLHHTVGWTHFNLIVR